MSVTLDELPEVAAIKTACVPKTERYPFKLIKIPGY
jgi:hypothetical protein